MNIFLTTLLTFLFVYGRIVEHEPNVTPSFAIALLGGFVLRGSLAYSVPVLGMFISNCFLGHYGISMSLAIYGSLLLPVLLASRTSSILGVYVYSFLCPVVFFITTNFVVWYGSGWYSQTWSGLINCYYMAIPFFKNTLMSSVYYTLLGSIILKLAYITVPSYSYKKCGVIT